MAQHHAQSGCGAALGTCRRVMPIHTAVDMGTLAATRRAGCPVPSKTWSLPISHSVRKPSPEVLHEVCPVVQQSLGQGTRFGALSAACAAG